MKKQITLLFILANLFANAQTFTVGFELLKKIECENTNNGSIKAKPINISGSFIGYTYKWSNNATTQTISNLSPGTYGVTITGLRFGQTSVIKSSSFSIQYQPKISYTSEIKLSCPTNNIGSVKLTPSGGVPPYTYQWKIGNDEGTVNPAINLPSGGFKFTITDFTGCRRSGWVEIGEKNIKITKYDVSHVSCFKGRNGSIKLTLEPFGAYQYKWSDGSVGPVLKDVSAGLYRPTITATGGAADGCIITPTYIEIKEPTILKVAEIYKDPSCWNKADGIMKLEVSGGTPPYKYSWKDGDSTQLRSKIEVGYRYSYTVSDKNLCSRESAFKPDSPEKIYAKLDLIKHKQGMTGGQIFVTPQNGIAPVTPKWYDQNYHFYSSSEDLTNLNAGIYYLTLKDANQCYNIDTFEILQLTAVDKTILEKLKVYYSYTDQKVHLKYLENIEIKSMHIYDLQGKQILHFPNPKDVEEIDLSDIPMDLYVLQMETALGQASVKISKVSRE
jgi:hypothetical protein